jgi:hypothetical protein
LKKRVQHTWNPLDENALKFCWVEYEKHENDFESPQNKF